jgi:hypothetical protein
MMREMALAGRKDSVSALNRPSRLVRTLPVFVRKPKTTGKAMNTISIGNDSRPLEQADPEWITQQINGRRKDGLPVCVRVSIHTAELNLTYSTPTCASSGGGGRPPTAREREILDLWGKHGLNELDFAPGNVVAFVRQVLRQL